MNFSNKQDDLGKALSNLLGYISYIKIERICTLKFAYNQ